MAILKIVKELFNMTCVLTAIGIVGYLMMALATFGSVILFLAIAPWIM